MCIGAGDALELEHLRAMALRLPLRPDLGLEPDDLAHEGWIAAQRALERYDGAKQRAGDVRGRKEWAKRRALGAMRDVIREALRQAGQHGRSSHGPVRACDPGELARKPSAQPEPWEALAEQDAVAGLLGALRPRLRQVALWRLRGVSLRAIGARMGVSESRACQLWAKALPVLMRAGRVMGAAW